jgi:hypothetical protein
MIFLNKKKVLSLFNNLKRNTMKIELKNVLFNERFSDETNAFVADVYIDGKKIGYAKNDGQGGNTWVQLYPEARAKFDECNIWLKTQPQINIGSENDPYMVDCNMETMVDSLFEQWLNEKETKKFEKKMETRLMWGVPNGMSYKEVKFEKPLNQIPDPVLQSYLDKYKKGFKDGEKFLNTNLVGFNL